MSSVFLLFPHFLSHPHRTTFSIESRHWSAVFFLDFVVCFWVSKRDLLFFATLPIRALSTVACRPSETVDRRTRCTCRAVWGGGGAYGRWVGPAGKWVGLGVGPPGRAGGANGGRVFTRCHRHCSTSRSLLLLLFVC